jgi:hypothetical protein
MRISVTHLDGFDYYLNSDLSTDEYINQLTSFRDNRPMQIGRAYESILQNPHLFDRYNHYECDGIKFDNSIINQIKQFQDVKVWQLKTTSKYDINGLEVTLSGKLDCMLGNTIIDIKTTANYDYDKYYNSYQWRCYLDMFKLNHFKYFVATIKDSEIVEINNINEIDCFAYSEMNNDIKDKLSKFTSFILDMKLEHIFKDK